VCGVGSEDLIQAVINWRMHERAGVCATERMICRVCRMCRMCRNVHVCMSSSYSHTVSEKRVLILKGVKAGALFKVTASQINVHKFDSVSFFCNIWEGAFTLPQFLLLNCSVASQCDI
jgi:hypothetical protein